MTVPRLGLGVITYNSRGHIDRCLESVLTAVRDLPGGADLVVVDNASPDSTGAYLADTWAPRGVRVIQRPDNAGYAAGVNTIARAVGGEYLAILNPDLELRPDTLRLALEYLEQAPTVGLLGANLLNPGGVSELVYGALPSPFILWYAYSGLRRAYIRPDWDLGRGIVSGVTEPFGVGYPCGALWFIRRAAWEEVGPFDERYFLYFEETDWATRCHQTTWRIEVHPGIIAMHEGAGSSGKDEESLTRTHVRFFRSAFQYLAKHYGVGAARSTYRWLSTTLAFKAGLLRLGIGQGIGMNQRVIREGLLANRSFVLGPELSGDRQPIVHPPSPAEALS